MFIKLREVLLTQYIGAFLIALLAWQAAVDTASKELASETADQATRTKANEEFSKLYQQRTQFMKEDKTGFVWLYLQK